MAGSAGVLALQGDYRAHARAIEACGARVIEVNRAAQLDEIGGLVIPGGESTTMVKLLHDEGLWEPLREFGRRKPIFGTCAGAIVIARDVSSPKQPSLELMDLGVERNAYGRQIDSHIATIAAGELGEMEAVFIRAPIIRRTGPGVRVLATHRGDPVLVEEGLHLAATFHPELTSDPRVHRRFLAKLES
ncbi:MAG: pyridoxal 5'-phosphate synthase glutaminase subunit PdxT [Bryobacteraceae bacterium]|nr:pyridoxal 5'-phosphate synthase glutaminase subunit PdxT [Bryobacteraceae bacterium]